MRLRHPDNHNLIYHSGSTWNGLPVLDKHVPLIHSYLSSIHEVMQRAVQEHPRTFGVRFDLHFPSGWNALDGDAISRFIDSLKAQIAADLHRRRQERKDGRVHPCRLRYVWVKEQDASAAPHYHVFIFLNRDAYFSLGNFQVQQTVWEDMPPAQGKANMAERIQKGWASALGLPLLMARGLVHFPVKCCYSIDANSPDFEEMFKDAFRRASYFAKAHSKCYGDGSNKFGCSRG
jgi:hypothetical protein